MLIVSILIFFSFSITINVNHFSTDASGVVQQTSWYIWNSGVHSCFAAVPLRDHVFHISFPSSWNSHNIAKLFSPFGIYNFCSFNVWYIQGFTLDHGFPNRFRFPAPLCIWHFPKSKYWSLSRENLMLLVVFFHFLFRNALIFPYLLRCPQFYFINNQNTWLSCEINNNK